MTPDPSKPPGIKLHQVFLESARFEHSPDFLAHPPATSVGDLGIHLEFQFALDNEDPTKGAVRSVMRTTNVDGLYHFEIAMGALIEQDAANPNMTLRQYIASSSAALLIPFIREAVASITSRGRFGAVWLQPVNVSTLVQSTESVPVPAEEHRKRSRAKR